MKRRIRNVSNTLIALAAVLALIIGMSLNAVSDLSRNIVDRIFPVTYDVEFINGQHAALSDAKVVFSGNKAFVTSDDFKGSVNLNDAVFRCTDEAQLDMNTVREGVIYMILSFSAFSAAASIALFGVEVRYLAVRSTRRPISDSVKKQTRNAYREHYVAPHAA